MEEGSSAAGDWAGGGAGAARGAAAGGPGGLPDGLGVGGDGDDARDDVSTKLDSDDADEPETQRNIADRSGVE